MCDGFVRDGRVGPVGSGARIFPGQIVLGRTLLGGTLIECGVLGAGSAAEH
jgi:hypothetical protein